MENTEKKKRVISGVADIAWILAGGFIFACGLESFTAPASIAPGGVSGIAVALSHLTGINEGALYLLINIPLIIIGFVLLGRRMMLKTLLSVLSVTVFTDYVLSFVPNYKGDRILAAVFGGLLIGVGLGICYCRECTSGGTDILNKLINRRYPQISLGAVTFATDLAVIIAAAAVFREIESALYAVISIFVSSKAIDMLVYGSYEGKMLLIFSDLYLKISKEIMKGGRGVTFFKATGAYSKSEKQVICCAVRKNEYVRIKRLVKEIDPSAFMIISSAKEVLGQGFKEIN